MKIILIIAIILVGGPVLIPLALGFVALVAGCLIALVAVFASIVVMTVSAVIAGVVLVVNGIILLIPDFAVGIGLLGLGLILTALGVVGTVAGVRLCIIVLPAIFRKDTSAGSGMMTMMISFIVTTEQTGVISELTQWKAIRA